MGLKVSDLGESLSYTVLWLSGWGLAKVERGQSQVQHGFIKARLKNRFSTIIHASTHFSVRAKPLFCLLLLSGIPAFVPSAHTLGNTHEKFLYQS